MRRGAVLLLGTLLLLSTRSGAAPDGSFTIYAGGRRAGTEACEVSSADGRVLTIVRTELFRDGRRQHLRIEIETDAESGQVLGFRAKGIQADAVREVRLTAKGGSLAGEAGDGTETRPVTLDLPEGAVLVAEPFFTPWQLVLDTCNRDWADDEIEIPAVFPLEERTGIVRLERRREHALEIDGRVVIARRIVARPEHGEVANLWVDREGRIVVCALSVLGLSAVRGRSVRFGLEPGEDPPDPEGTASSRVRFASEGATLAGTVMVPAGGEGPRPAVLLLSGSGPHDRNGNVPRTELQWNFLHAFSVALARRGVTSLRYDDRGVGSSGGTFHDAGLGDLTADARSALRYLRSRGDVREGAVGVIGHSEGALLGAILAGEAGGPDALALLGAPAEPLHRMLLHQAGRKLAVRGTGDRERDRVIAEMRAFFTHVRLSDVDLLRWQGRDRDVSWLREHLEFVPAAAFGEVRCPTLVIQGGTDLQVPRAHAERVLAALGAVEKRAIVLSGLGHFLMRSGGKIEDYAETDREVATVALETVTSWFEERFRKTTEMPK